MKSDSLRLRIINVLLVIVGMAVIVLTGMILWRLRTSAEVAVSPTATTPAVAENVTATATAADAADAVDAAIVADESPKPSPSPSVAEPPAKGPSPTPTMTPSATATPTRTPLPSLTPTSLPQPNPTIGITGVGRLREGIPTPATEIPTPVPTFEIPDDTTNILLLGSDVPLRAENSRTDTMIIVAVNRSGPTASMISLPRDLLVYVPDKTMSRLNTAVNLGGVDLLKQTILYNFGIPIHYYARVDFAGFMSVVDTIGGVDITLTCRFQDWRLKSPELDPQVEENWEQFALEPGVHHMDGDLALWYARSRLSSNDFDRGRRQQKLLRALLNQGVDLGLVSQVPALWNTFQNSVDTDIDIGRILQLATLAPAIRENGVQNLYLAGKTESWVVPESGAQVQLPVWEGEGKMEETFRRLFLPPALSKAGRPPIYVEIINNTDNPDLALLAADNAAWYGLVPIVTPVETYPEFQEITSTTLRYYAPNFKGSYDWLVSWIFGRRRSQIELISDVETYPYDYQVILGDDFQPCLNDFYAPQPFLDQ